MGHDSATGLALALAKRPSRRMSASSASVAAEVLAGTAGHTLIALLSDAAAVLTLSVVLAAGLLRREEAGVKKEQVALMMMKSNARVTAMYCKLVMLLLVIHSLYHLMVLESNA